MTGVAIESKLHLYLYQHSVNSLYFLYLDEETRKSAATPSCTLGLNEVVFRQAKWPFRCLDGFFTELWMLTNWLALPPSHHCHSIKPDGPPNIRQAPIYVNRDCLQFFTNHLRFFKIIMPFICLKCEQLDADLWPKFSFPFIFRLLSFQAYWA